MSNANLNPALVNAFAERVNTITKQRLKWQSTAFKSANDALYAMLGEVYDLYMEAKGDSAENEQLREWLIDQCNAKQLPLSKKPTMLQMSVWMAKAQPPTSVSCVGCSKPSTPPSTRPGRPWCAW